MNKQWLGLAAAVAVTGCVGEWQTGGNIGGANRNARAPGNIPGGIAVRAGDVAVAPRGDWFVTLKGQQTMVGSVGGQEVKPATSVDKPDLLAFWTRGDGFFALHKDRAGPTNGETGRETLVSFDRANNREVWRKSLDRRTTRLDVANNRVLLTGNDLLFLDAADGRQVAVHQSATGVHDVDVIHGGAHVLITENTNWEGSDPATTLSVANTEDGTTESTTTTENCADDVEVSQDESTAYLAPTLCQKDPVTVLSLDGNVVSVRKQMPGFGPVAQSPNGGHMVVAFLDRDAEAPRGATIPDSVKNSRERYHLMFIDTQTLDFTTSPVGDELPRYAFTPDGSKLLVDTPMAFFSSIHVMDLASRTMRKVMGPPVQLNNFTLSPDSARAFVAENQLWVLDVNAASIRLTGLSVPPAGVNLTADGVTVLITQVTDRALIFMDALKTRETGRVNY